MSTGFISLDFGKSTEFPLSGFMFGDLKSSLLGTKNIPLLSSLFLSSRSRRRIFQYLIFVSDTRILRIKWLPGLRCLGI